MTKLDIKRDCEAYLYQEINEKAATILIGARQVGKTFLLHKISESAEAQGIKTAFFDLEQPSVSNQFNKRDAEIIKLITNSGKVVFIDEFHYLKNASRIFKAIYDSGIGTKIFASGSSSLAIHKHLKESLAGRKFIKKVFPCSLAEISQVIAEDTLNYYFKYGGLPGTIHQATAEKKMLVLEDILQSYVLKDIKALIKEENIRAFNHLLYLLAQNQGAVVSIASLANEIKMNARTVESYLEILKLTYVCYPVHSFSRNYANELKKSRKYYLYDLGIRNTLLKNFAPLSGRSDSGAIIESFVFLELCRQIGPENEIRFWRLKDGSEVDFIWVKNQKYFPIEVKATIKKDEIPPGLRAFISKYPDTKTAYIVSQNFTGQTQYRDTKINYIKLGKVALIPQQC